MPRTAIAREQKQFIKIAFAVHLSAAISAERYRSDSVTLKSAVSVFVYLCIVLMVHKYRQSAAQSCLRKKLSLSEITTDRTFENRRGKYKELGKKVPQAYRVYVKLILRSDAVIARIFVNVELDTETGLYYYGARYLDPKYSRWLSGDPAITDYMAGTSAGEGGIYNTVNLQLYHYAGNNPVKYTDPDGRQQAIAITPSDLQMFVESVKQTFSSVPTPLVVVGAVATGVIIADDYFDGAISEGIANGINFIADKTIEAGKWIGEKSKEFGTWIGGKLKTAWDNIFGAKDKKHTPDQQALNELGKEAKQNGGVSEKDAETLVNWGNEVGLPSRGPESHPNRPHGKEPHIHVGHNDHIPVLPE